MTMQFLASVRRNQKQWMVVLTILSIFAFLFDDVVRGANNLTANSTALFFAVLCAGGMSILGYPRGHTVMFGLIGFVVGGGVALVGATYAGPKPVAKTVFESISHQRIYELQNRRLKANQFLAVAAEKVKSPTGAASFGEGSTSVSSMVAFSVLLREAQRMGVTVTDESINRFLKDATQDKLSQKDYIAALRDVGIGESELFDIMRQELQAQLVQRLLVAPSNYHQFMAQLTRGQLNGRIAQMSPEQLWENFCKLHVRQQLTTAAVPVSEFVKLVAEPSDTELKEYFDKRKARSGDDQGNPGFLEPPKVKLAYLMASNLETYEKGLSNPTDQEVVDYYLAHQQEYRVNQFPPDLDMPDLKGNEDPDAPADALAPANVGAEKPVEPGPGPLNPPPADNPAAKPSSDEPKKDDLKKEEPKKEGAKASDPPGGEAKKSDSDGADCGEDEKPKDEIKKDEAAKKESPDEPAKPAAEGADKPKSATEDKAPTPPAPALPEDPPGLRLPAPMLGAPGQGPIAPPKLRELDDELKLEIREKLLLQKAFDRMGEARESAFEAMMEMSLRYLAADKANQAKVAETFADECKKYAAKHGFEYVETKEMSQMELATSLDERIGQASESVTRRNARSVSEVVFDRVPSGTKFRVGLYSPQRADSPKARYAYWKIEEIPEKVPDLKDDATRQLVVASWKFEKARELAEKRARELAELAKKSPTDIAGAMSGQTINGTKESPPVAVRETAKFTWMRISNSVPSMGMSIPAESTIDQIEDAGSDILKLVFEQLGPGDVGVGLNRSKTAYYVVRVHDRDGTEPQADGIVPLHELQQQFLKERFTSFLPTPYDFIGLGMQQRLDYSWRMNFDKRFKVSFENLLPEVESE